MAASSLAHLGIDGRRLWGLGHVNELRQFTILVVGFAPLRASVVPTWQHPTRTHTRPPKPMEAP